VVADQLEYLTRILRQDGNYWFELENKAATKSKVTRLLSKFGVDPDNMLIIMHQNMVEQFTVLPPQERLRMVEEESVGKLLESAEQTLTYWREQYDRYQRKKQLRIKRRFLERELAWAEAAKKQGKVDDLKEHITTRQNEIQEIENNIKTTSEQMDKLQTQLDQSKAQWKKLLEERLALERQKGRNESHLSVANQTLRETQSWITLLEKEMGQTLEKVQLLETNLHEGKNPPNPNPEPAEFRTIYEDLEKSWAHRFSLKSQSLEESAKDFNQNLQEVEARISNVSERIDHLNFAIEGTYSDIADHKIKVALMEYRKDDLTKAVKRLDKEL